MPVVDAIDRAVRDYPHSTALATARGSMSYREMGAFVGDLAGRMRRATSLGEFVGIQSSRRMGTVVAMLAALKAARPFVVIDARDSESSNSGKVSLLGVKMLAQSSADGATVDLAEVPAHRPRAQRASAHADSADGTSAVGCQPEPGRAFDEGELCYAIYTSGSTGTPKCVLVRTAALAPVISDHVARLSVGPDSTTLQFARLTFDGCITEILWTLTAGGCLVVLDEEHLVPGPVLRTTLERFGVTHFKATPFALTVTEPSGAMRLKHVINGGGVCRRSVISKWSAVASFHNAYGLTETTICNLLSGALDPRECRETAPLGERVGDCGFYVRDIDAAGPGMAKAAARRGELVITGPSVAAGYLTEQGLRPFGSPGGQSAFRTGDVVEMRGGQLHFIQRLDRRLKVRGYRLDPGEIENAVCQLDSVRDAVVVAEARDDAETSDLDVLVCYYLGDADPRSVRKHLRSVLDPYKIPSVIEQAEAFAYTPNGKVDLDALRARRAAFMAAEKPVSPGAQVLRLVRSLTGISDVSLEDNFFDVGGDSASAVVLVAKMKELGWVDAGVRDVLRAENLRMLADRLHEQRISERSG